jgi:hypothetical protein
LTAATAALLAVASLIAGPAWVSASPSRATVSRCTHGYSYAGLASSGGVDGVAATITALRRPSVASGHAAAWVGVGGVHQGVGGASEWLQAGVAAFPREGLHLYVEAVSRGDARRFVDLGRAVPGRSYRVQVVETAPDLWQASIDGRVVGKPAYLPTVGGSWRGVATAESWAANHASCNGYAYRFKRVSARTGSRWQAFAGSERVGAAVSRDRAGFAAVAYS